LFLHVIAMPLAETDS